MAPKVPIRIIVAMTGATGAALGVKLLQTLRRMDIETHLIISKWAASNLTYETDYTVKEVKALATKSYSSSDVSAPISSGSFRTRGMIIVPCSMKTLSAVATGFGEDLITRAADVILKERRKLVVVARETPLNGIHLQNMTTIHNNGGINFPPVPAFYTRPQSVDDIVTQSVGRMLDMFDLDAGDFERWSGL
ncbi:phenylacrylic acid decarboxylase [Boeremia exigua]|uniref:phenylacrylic acid decarboxylase n=1 Tax=Boeremia exigua TaxID=749465 RepID=UPI001E8D9011|nr:phenylacrylic acid decarboxylase [Boeremia exigua]KAH6638477.1 phenylacrylic acid decarboxylase [Boeremia exigua]